MKKPDLKTRDMALSLDYANRLLGVSLSAPEVKKLLEKMRYGAEVKGKEVIAKVPAYRTDVLHPMDLVEDIAIAYGYENFKPELPKISTVGEKSAANTFASAAREVMLGLGFTEVMTLILTNESNLFTRMNTPKEETVATKNPVSTEHSVPRTWLLPSLMAVLEKNKNREYPQKIFEIGYCINAQGREEKKMAAVVAHAKTDFSEIKAVVGSLIENLGGVCDAAPMEHGSFIPGRCAKTHAAFFGELHPQVLENFGLETPATAFELSLSAVREKK
jgi:phenylalanyl-tRNA synthetase beta chain